MSKFKTQKAIHNWLKQGKLIKSVSTLISNETGKKTVSVFYYKLIGDQIYYTTHILLKCGYWNRSTGSLETWFKKPNSVTNFTFGVHTRVLERSSLKKASKENNITFKGPVKGKQAW